MDFEVRLLKTSMLTNICLHCTKILSFEALFKFNNGLYTGIV